MVINHSIDGFDDDGDGDHDDDDDGYDAAANDGDDMTVTMVMGTAMTIFSPVTRPDTFASLKTREEPTTVLACQVGMSHNGYVSPMGNQFASKPAPMARSRAPAKPNGDTQHSPLPIGTKMDWRTWLSIRSGARSFGTATSVQSINQFWQMQRLSKFSGSV